MVTADKREIGISDFQLFGNPEQLPDNGQVIVSILVLMENKRLLFPN
jgi:hypothetical protein